MSAVARLRSVSGRLASIGSGPLRISTTLRDLHVTSQSGSAGYVNGVDVVHFLRTGPEIGTSTVHNFPVSIGQFTLWRTTARRARTMAWLFFPSNIVGSADYDGATGEVEVVLTNEQGEQVYTATVFRFNVRRSGWNASGSINGYHVITDQTNGANLDAAGITAAHAHAGNITSVNIRASFPTAE